MNGRSYLPKVRRAFDPTHTHFPKCSEEKGCYFETKNYWIRYSIRGTVYDENAHTPSKRAADKFLRDRIAARETGKLIGRPQDVTFATLRKGLEESYARKGNRSLVRAQQALAHLDEFFGADTMALDITPHWVNMYTEQRLTADEAGRGTVRYELAILRRAFAVAMKTGTLALRPTFDLPAEADPRTGFFSQADLAALLVELPQHIVPVVKFGYYTGWRKDEVTGLLWDRVDWEGKVIRLTQAETKGKEGRVFPFAAAPDLEALLTEQWDKRDGPYVFQDHGRHVMSFYKAWDSACERAGLAGRIYHDLRRTAARDMFNHGIRETDVMRLCGWKTLVMFRRYCIIDEKALSDAVAMRFGTQESVSPEPEMGQGTGEQKGKQQGNKTAKPGDLAA